MEQTSKPPWMIDNLPSEAENAHLLAEYGTTPEEAQTYLRLIGLDPEVWGRVMKEGGGDADTRAHIIVASGNKPRLVGHIAKALEDEDNLSPKVPPGIWEYTNQ